MNAPPTHTHTGSIGGYEKEEASENQEVRETEEMPPSPEEEDLESPISPQKTSQSDGVTTAVVSSKPGSQAPQDASQTPNREVNKRYKDLQETGRWGDISKREIYVVAGLLILVVAAVIGVTVYFVTKDNGSSSSSDLPPVSQSPTAPPTEAAVLSPEAELALIREAVAANPYAQDNLSLLPDDASFYQNKFRDPTASAIVRAASWVIHEDPIDSPSTLLERYALATFYFTTEGDQWSDNTNWLTATHFCEWNGVACDRLQETIVALDLTSNNVNGPIPVELNFLQSIREISLTDNIMTGILPGLPLGTLPSLTILYLNSNQLTGEVSADLRANGVLNTLFIQQNNFTGNFPFEFCPRFVGDPPILQEFGLDCFEVSCFCCADFNCF